MRASTIVVALFAAVASAQFSDWSYPECAIKRVHTPLTGKCRPDDLHCLCGSHTYRGATSVCFKIQCHGEEETEAFAAQDRMCKHFD